MAKQHLYWAKLKVAEAVPVPLWEIDGQEKKPSLVEAEESDVVTPSKEINVPKFIGDQTLKSLDTIFENAIATSGADLSKTLSFTLTHFSSGILDVAKYTVEVKQDIQSGTTTAKALNTNGVVLATETVAGWGTKQVFKIAVSQAIKSGLIAAGAATAWPVVAVGFGTAVAVAFAFDALGYDTDLKNWASGVYDKIFGIEQKIAPDPSQQRIEEHGLDIKVKTGEGYDEIVRIVNPVGGNTFVLNNSLYIVNSHDDTGNDLFVRSGTLSVDKSVDKVDQKHSIIDGGAGEDTISYAGVTSFSTGLEINLKEGVSTPRGEDNGYPLDVLDNFEHAIGTPMADDIIGNTESNKLQGGDGADLIAGHLGDDVIIGGKGADTLAGKWLLAFGALPSGLDGNDVLVGGANNDTLYGGEGNDKLFGGTGDDTLVVSVADTTVSGTTTLLGGLGEDILWGGRLSDTVIGSDDNERDYLHGEKGDDLIVGGSGDRIASAATIPAQILHHHSTISHLCLHAQAVC